MLFRSSHSLYICNTHHCDLQSDSRLTSSLQVTMASPRQKSTTNFEFRNVSGCFFALPEPQEGLPEPAPASLSSPTAPSWKAPRLLPPARLPLLCKVHRAGRRGRREEGGGRRKEEGGRKRERKQRENKLIIPTLDGSLQDRKSTRLNSSH